jgi:hypothetical protein
MTFHSAVKKGELAFALGPMLAEWTGLEPATPGVTGRYSNQLNYHSFQLSAFSTQLSATPSPSPAVLLIADC